MRERGRLGWGGGNRAVVATAAASDCVCTAADDGDARYPTHTHTGGVHGQPLLLTATVC